MTKEEIEVVKNFIAEVDYHLDNKDRRKANRVMNDMCIYLLKKEGYTSQTTTDFVDILSGFKKRLVSFGMHEPSVTIPHTRYEKNKEIYTGTNKEDDKFNIFTKC